MAKYGTPNVILDMKAPYYTLPCLISNTGVSTNNEGRKIIPAGTPVGGTTNVLLNRQTVLSTTNSSGAGANTQGILIHDLDVTNGNASGTVAFMGIIDVAKTNVVIDTAVKIPNTIILMKGRAF